MCRCNSCVTLEQWCPRSWEADPPLQKPLCVSARPCCSNSTPGLGWGTEPTAPPGAHSTFSTAGCRTATPCVCLWDRETLCSHRQLWARGCLTFCFLLPLPALHCSPSGPPELWITEAAGQELTCEFPGVHSCCWARPVDWSWGGMSVMFSLDTGHGTPELCSGTQGVIWGNFGFCTRTGGV